MRRYGPMIVIASALALLYAPALTAASQPADAASDTWECGPAGSLAEARADHTATLLPDGRVLIIGGERGREKLASAEIWDPLSGEFNPTGSLAEARKWHAATLLPDGRVLVAGGLGNSVRYGDDFLASAEIWDPLSGAFSPTGSMADSRIYHTVTLFGDGRVLAVGGIVLSIVPLRSAEIWDPSTGEWTATDPLDQWRFDHTATLLDDGRVLVIGGGSFTADGFETFDVCEVWDPATGAFRPAGRLWLPRMGHSAVRLPDGRVLVVGGTLMEARRPQPRAEQTHPLLRADRHDPRDHQLTHPLLRAGDLGQRRPREDRRESLASAEVWLPAAGSFERAGWLGSITGRTHAALLPDGRVFVVGDSSDTDPALAAPSADAEVWDPETAAFSPAGSLAGPRGGQTLTTLPDGRALVVGGRDEHGFALATAELCGLPAEWPQAAAPQQRRFVDMPCSSRARVRSPTASR